MKDREKEFDEIFDLFAIRVIVSEKDACYAALGLIHQLYTPVQDRFKDYIATPKRNGYQSINFSRRRTNDFILFIKTRWDQFK